MSLVLQDKCNIEIYLSPALEYSSCNPAIYIKDSPILIVFFLFGKPVTRILSDFINLTQAHNFTVSAQDIFTFRRLSVFTVSFTRILQLVMEIMQLFPLYY